MLGISLTFGLSPQLSFLWSLLLPFFLFLTSPNCEVVRAISTSKTMPKKIPSSFGQSHSIRKDAGKLLLPAYALDILASHIFISCHDPIHLYAPHPMFLFFSVPYIYYPVPRSTATRTSAFPHFLNPSTCWTTAQNPLFPPSSDA